MLTSMVGVLGDALRTLATAVAEERRRRSNQAADMSSACGEERNVDVPTVGEKSESFAVFKGGGGW